MFRPFALTRSRRWVWFALCVFTLSAWMPTLSAWVASARATTDLMTICSSTGARQIGESADQAQADADGKARHLNGQGHCPFCLLQDHSPVVPATPAAIVTPLSALASWVPPLLLQAARPLHAWSPLAARAPPLAA
ncbi:MAG TPA: DUF2946 domain-containing protein [Aquabacterium sp.]|uniref:DUF2946 domain-containing protein n=1 Tax=Aquabacterium sp. TaxID=1872578 RepID=UPI002E2F6777|nr:DUF2946 domain-containing protein [Aquabacterium sp.]HEX5371936.1 DUF2946 domain-containing protein [Aquabacterium sp.]